MQQRFATILWVVILSAGLISGKTTSAAPAKAFPLDTQLAGPGRYIVTASSPGAEPGNASFQLVPPAALRPQEGSGVIFQVPAGIAFKKALFLPAVYR